MERRPPLPNPLTPDPIGLEQEESLIQDIRAGVTPSQMVERKLASLGEACPQLQSRMPAAALSRPA
jgi:hypothetical protein